MSKEDRRKQLIKATIKCIANKGLSNTTMADVTGEAGLSLGIVNLHFQSKDKLLEETLRFVADEYNRGQANMINSDSPLAEKMQAMVDFDFSPSICQKNKLAVWFAFWGETKARPTYQQICSQSDIEVESSILTLFKQVIAEGHYKNFDAEMIMRGYSAIMQGLWLDMLLSPRIFTREKAKQIATHYLSSFFPEHF